MRLALRLSRLVGLISCCLGALLTALVMYRWLEIHSVTNPGSQSLALPDADTPQRVYRRTANFGAIAASTSLSIGFPELGERKILKVDTSCGCVVSNLQVGKVFDFSDQVKLHLNVAGKQPGFGRQVLRIELAGDELFELEVQYLFAPPPAFDPQYAVFETGECEHTILIRNASNSCTFPRLLSSVDGFQVIIEKPSELNSCWQVHLTLDREKISHGQVKGFLDFQIEEEKRPLRLPYLVLDNR